MYITTEDKNNVIQMLAENYPKCFFETARYRRPLKKNIVADLEREGFPVAPELLSASIDRYMSNYSYQYNQQQAGTKRVDLNGAEVGTVSEPEAIAAQTKVSEIRAAQEAQKQVAQRNPVTVLRDLHAAGHIPDDAVKKLDIPPAPKVIPMTKDEIRVVSERVPELAPIYDALDEANNTLITVGTKYRVAILQTVKEELKRVIGEMGNRRET